LKTFEVGVGVIPNPSLQICISSGGQNGAQVYDKKSRGASDKQNIERRNNPSEKKKKKNVSKMRINKELALKSMMTLYTP
jgi:hypothetical protein